MPRTSITGGSWNSFFLDDNDNVWGCGLNNFSNQGGNKVSHFLELENLKNICSVDSGYSHSLFLDQDGKVFSCGTDNSDGVLGRSIEANSATQPTMIASLPKITSIAASFKNHSFFLDEDKNVWTCGDNSRGQLGLGVPQGSVSFASKVKIAPIKSVAAGWMHSVFLDEDGAPWACGNNNYGELGLGDRENRSNAEKIENLPSIKEIFAGCQHTMFLADDGSIWGTGYNSSGELGFSGTHIDRPTKIEGLPEIRMIALGWNHSLFLDFSGRVWACGSNSNYQLGMTNTSETQKPTELKIESPEIQSIAAGANHSLFVDAENSLWTCGNNKWKQLGLGSVTEESECFVAQKVRDVPKVKIDKYRNVKSARKVV